MILIRDDKSKCILAFLIEYDLERNLAQVRTQIHEQLSGFVSKDFIFTLYGCPIGELQENNYLLKQCVSSTSEDGFKYEISIMNCSNSETVLASMGSETKQDITVESETKTEDRKTKIKRYTKDELEDSSSLLEKERKVFWNNKAYEVENDISLREWGVQALHGVIDVAWTMKKTELLTLNVKKYETLRKKDSHDNVGKALMKNLERVEKAHAAVNMNYQFLCKEVAAGKISQEDMEEKFSKNISELKKAQADLLKSCEQFTSKCTEVSLTNSDNYFPDLNEAEMGSLVKDVCIDDYESA